VPAYLNNAATTDTYTDPNTVVFAYGRKSFSAQVSNGSIFYTLGYIRPGARALDWMPEEHYTVQALLTFADVEGEGYLRGHHSVASRFAPVPLASQHE
jgi:hypothetical protein